MPPPNDSTMPVPQNSQAMSGCPGHRPGWTGAEGRAIWSVKQQPVHQLLLSLSGCPEDFREQLGHKREAGSSMLDGEPWPRAETDQGHRLR